VPGDSRDSVSDQDLAIVTAKQKLALIKERPGYRDAMKLTVQSGVARAVVLFAAACCGGLMYACKLYVSVAWLMWILVVMFGVLALFFVLAAIGFSPKLAGEKWGAAVVGKQLADSKHRIKFLRETGAEHELEVSEQIYGLLRAGDVGVLHVSGSAPDFTVDSFTRL